LTKSEAVPSAPKYRLKFLPEVLVEWHALDGSVKEVLRKALKKRLEQPRTPSRVAGPA
jgi:mRNA interferase RelE/StbE